MVLIKSALQPVTYSFLEELAEKNSLYTCLNEQQDEMELEIVDHIDNVTDDLNVLLHEAKELGAEFLVLHI